MKQSDLYENLKNPDSYKEDVESIDIHQTHISFVALTGKYAYKVKKPVDFGFLDFSTLDRRKKFCQEELRLNKRLCPDIYLDVVKITKKNDGIEFNGSGEIVDYAVKMREFSQKNIMKNLLFRDKITKETVDDICNILVDFYKKGENSDDIDKFGRVDIIKKNTDENFNQTKNMIGVTIKKDVYNFIKKETNNFLKEHKEIFDKRINDGFIHDCHGDLHSGNIVIEDDEIFIFDCIEFNKRFRYSDVASDIGFLAMDLDYQGFPYLSSHLIKRYIEKSNDEGIFDVINFYKCYRAYVRGKVIGFRLNDDNISNKEKNDIKKIAGRYYDLAYYYAKLFSNADYKKTVFITSGLTGTGKTTISDKISVDYDAYIISTDMIRKELAGIDKYERHHVEYNKGLYSPERMEETYNKVIEKAENQLKKDRNVVLDATFKTKKHRKMVKKMAEKNNSRFIILHCDCPEDVVKKWLDERVKKKSVSDGRWEIYVKQKDSFEDFEDKNDVISIDVSNKDLSYQIRVYNKIIDKIIEG